MPTSRRSSANSSSATPAQELARIRPLASRLGVSAPIPSEPIEACLQAASCGLLAVHWDILCPTCRVSADVKDTLNAIESHARCEVCDLDFDVDFGNSLELIFRAHPELRDVDLKTYCIGGPEHLPHVVAQVRVAPGERIDLNLQLAEGTYRLRGPQLPYSVPSKSIAVARSVARRCGLRRQCGFVGRRPCCARDANCSLCGMTTVANY